MERLQRIATGFMQAKILLAAAELGLFDLLAPDGADADQVCAALDAELRGVEILLDALVAMEILTKEADRYHLPAELEPWLRDDGETHFVAQLRHRNHMFRRWAALEDRVLGRPSARALDTPRAVVQDGRANDAFIRAMFSGGRRQAPAIVDRLPLEGARRVADLGGGPGHYLMEMARRDAALEPWLIDLPLTLETARRVLTGRDVAARVQMVSWDFYDDPAPPTLPDFDLLFLSQVIHAESPARNRALLHKLRPLLAAGGRLVIHENVVGPDRTSPPEAALFAVNMLAMTEAGRTYTEAEIGAWLRGAGFVVESVERLSGRSVLITAGRAGAGVTFEG
jgi:hypothetical protein